jgi:hypothetical protein
MKKERRNDPPLVSYASRWISYRAPPLPSLSLWGCFVESRALIRLTSMT